MYSNKKKNSDNTVCEEMGIEKNETLVKFTYINSQYVTLPELT